MSRNWPSGSPPDVGVILPAAGRGERAGPGDLKQFRPIAGVPMLLRAVRPFAQHPRVADIVVALPPDHLAHPPAWLADLVGGRLRLVAGGAARADSVRAALWALDPSCRLVLVHDAARPFVSRDTIDAVLTRASGGVGAVPAVAVTDTLKRTGEASARIVETVARGRLWRAQTPQGFPRSMLEQAFARAADADCSAFTDEAALLEHLGLPVEVVADQSSNLKVTTPEDFLLAEALAAQ